MGFSESDTLCQKTEILQFGSSSIGIPGIIDTVALTHTEHHPLHSALLTNTRIWCKGNLQFLVERLQRLNYPVQSTGERGNPMPYIYISYEQGRGAPEVDHCYFDTM